jgi:predicted acylesterase/phospholipase RssA
MYRRIYLCGGGINAICHIGTLEELEKRSMLVCIKEWMGISAGAFTAMTMVAGYTLSEMKDFTLRFDYSTISDPDEVTGWITNLGYDTGARLRRLIKSILHQKGHDDTVTFQKFYETTKKVFRVFATDLNAGTLITFDAIKTPDYPVIDAILASMSIPGYFQPVTCPTTGHLLCDGWVVTNYPYDYIDRPESSDILYVSILQTIEHKESIELLDILGRPFELMINNRASMTIQPYRHNTIVTELRSKSAVEFGMALEDKLNIIELGKNAVVRFFTQKPVRRYSVS